jgi:hypothetical protein
VKKFGGKNLRGKFWREYFGVKFWRNFGGKNLKGEFWREYFGVKFWGIFWGGGGDFGEKFIFIFIFLFFYFFLGGGGHLEGKDHYACYNNVIGRVSICIILCSQREWMASSDKKYFVSETSTNCSPTSSVGTRKCDRNVCKANEASYFSASQNFDHSASNFIQHVPHESPESDYFEGTDDEEDEYDGDKSIQEFNNNENSKM